MNIFAVDINPVVAAQSLVDRHVVKMILESTQMLCLSHYLSGCSEDAPIWRSFAWKHHPCSKWVMASVSNYRWLALHNVALCDEYNYRYGKIHKVLGLVTWLAHNEPKIADIGLLPFVLATKDVYGDDPVETYRRYYLTNKNHLFCWTKRKPPQWVICIVPMFFKHGKWIQEGKYA